MNLLEATYDRDQRVLSVGNTLLPAPDGAAWPDRAAMTVAIRPEDLHTVDRDGPAAFSGAIDEIMDLGHYRQIGVQTSAAGTLTMIRGKDVMPTMGETVTVAPTRYLVYSGRPGQLGTVASADTPPPDEVRLSPASVAAEAASRVMRARG